MSNENIIVKALNNISDKLDVLISLLSGRVLPNESTLSKCNFYEWVDEWFKTYKVPRLSDKGYQLNLAINKWIKPYIEDKPLDMINSLEITKLINTIPYPRTKQIVRNALNQIFAKACELKFIKDNPVAYVDKVRHVYQNGRALSPKEQKEFLKKIKGNQYEHLFRFYLLTGCRRAEALSIQWTDIKGAQLHINGTKTEKSKRDFPIYDELAQLLEEIPKGRMLLFPYKVRAVDKAFAKIRSTLSFQDITIHDLRHTFATNCVESGMELKTVQMLLGHSKVTTTANIYTHISDDFLMREVKKLSTKKAPKKR